MIRHLLKSLVPIGLCLAVFFDGLIPSALAQRLPARIDLTVVEGEGVTTKIRQRVPGNLAVKVEDDDHQPVAGVVVVFALPVSGTSGEFAGGSKTTMVLSDKSGMAVAHDLRTNDIPGKLQIYVTASFQGLRARTLINQTVEGPPGAKPEPLQTAKSGGKWKWVVLGLVAGGGAGAGVFLGTHKSSSPAAPPPPISIAAGAVTFGAPR